MARRLLRWPFTNLILLSSLVLYLRLWEEPFRPLGAILVAPAWFYGALVGSFLAPLRPDPTLIGDLTFATFRWVVFLGIPITLDLALAFVRRSVFSRPA
jgi:hypothetical protein